MSKLEQILSMLQLAATGAAQALQPGAIQTDIELGVVMLAVIGKLLPHAQAHAAGVAGVVVSTAPAEPVEPVVDPVPATVPTQPAHNPTF